MQKLGFPGFLGRSRAPSDASTNLSTRPERHNPQPGIDFTTFIDELKPKYKGRNGKHEQKPYIPRDELSQYWTKGRVREICQAYTPDLSIVFEAVKERCLRLFSILVYTRRVQYFDTLQGKISDEHLPILRDSLPQALLAPEYEDVLDDLFRHQWLFCPLVLDYARLNHLHIQPEHILPFYDEEKIKEGDSANIFKIKVSNTCIKGEAKTAQDRVYVLKSYTENDIRLFKSESRALTTLQQGPGSEHIVKYYGSFIQNGTFNLLLQFANNGNLLDYYRETTPPTTPADIHQFWKSLFGILKGLHYVHKIRPSTEETGEYRGIHEDIKPDNIILNKGTSASLYDFCPLLTDFGHSHFKVAKPEEDDLGLDRQGNQIYGAPESSRHARYRRGLPGEISTKADIFSIGCVISDAAAWLVLGPEGRERYQELRIEVGKNDPSFEDEGHFDCFHDAVKRSRAVDEMHNLIRAKCLPEDTITPKVLDLIQDHMLRELKNRETASEVFEKFQKFHKRPVLREMVRTVQGVGKIGLERLDEFTRDVTESIPFRDREDEAEEKMPTEEVSTESDIRTQEVDNGNISRTSQPNTAKESMRKVIGVWKGKGKLSSSNSTTAAAAGSETTDMNNGDDQLPPQSLPDINLSASPNLPPRPEPALPPYDATTLSPLSGYSSTDPFSYGSETTSFSSPPADSNYEPSVIRLVDDNTLAELELSLEEARQWRVSKKSGDLHRDKSSIITSLQKTLRDRDYIFFLDDSRTMKHHSAEVESAFETLTYMMKPQKSSKDWGTVSLALGSSYIGSQQKTSLHTDSRTTPLLKTLKDKCAYERIETMMEEVFAEFVEREIIPKLPGQSTYRSRNPSNTDLPGTGSKMPDLRRTSSNSKKPTSRVSLVVFTDGQWGKGKDGARVDRVILKLIGIMRERELKRTQVMIQFVRFGDGEDGIRHLEYLAGLGREDEDTGETEYDIVYTEPITGNVCSMLIGSAGSVRRETPKQIADVVSIKSASGSTDVGGETHGVLRY